MNTASRTRSHFGYWSFHVSLNAAPSFILACVTSTPPLGARLTGMLAGVAVFIIGYTCLTGSSWFRRRIDGGPFGKAFDLATRIRSAIATIGLIGTFGFIPQLSFLSVLTSLEIWAGFVSGSVVEGLGKTAMIGRVRTLLTSDIASERAKSWWLGDMNSTIPTFVWTLTEGVLLSLMMLCLAVVIYWIEKTRGSFGRWFRK